MYLAGELALLLCMLGIVGLRQQWVQRVDQLLLTSLFVFTLTHNNNNNNNHMSTNNTSLGYARGNLSYYLYLKAQNVQNLRYVKSFLFFVGPVCAQQSCHQHSHTFTCLHSDETYRLYLSLYENNHLSWLWLIWFLFYFCYLVFYCLLCCCIYWILCSSLFQMFSAKFLELHLL